ncbi:MAG: hypothetical protein NVSMB66_4460 [Candidatus Doudnabacteria bacterium]
MSMETMPQLEDMIERFDTDTEVSDRHFDFDSPKDRNRMQIEVALALGVPKDELAEWMYTNAQNLGELVDEDPDFREFAENGDWENAKKILVEKLSV